MTDWPDSFDFETDETCQSVFKPFIEAGMAALAEYDARRNHKSAYIFPEHAGRVAACIKQTCLYMDLEPHIANNMYWATLPHDLGKRFLPPAIWDSEEKPTEGLKHQRRTHTDLGADHAEEALKAVSHPFKPLMLDIMRNHHEEMDGGGFHGLKGTQLSAPVRLACIVEAFDGWRIPRPHFGERDISVPGVLKRMREEKGPAVFDMDLFEPFAAMMLAQ